LFKASAVDDAKRQIVKGIRYILEVEISRTMCRKRGNTDDLNNCSFQTDSLLREVKMRYAKRFVCTRSLTAASAA
uniref:Cystatin domain-containing protein n=1 Tax=Sinocyclocheilus rhinocerous TaxID=307959 RepID=A0A673G5U1_9TELE